MSFMKKIFGWKGKEILETDYTGPTPARIEELAATARKDDFNNISPMCYGLLQTIAIFAYFL